MQFMHVMHIVEASLKELIKVPNFTYICTTQSKSNCISYIESVQHDADSPVALTLREPESTKCCMKELAEERALLLGGTSINVPINAMLRLR